MAKYYTAKAKVWKNHEGDLVEDGNVTAAFLLARKGQKIAAVYLAGHDNASEFFDIPQEPTKLAYAETASKRSKK